MEVRLLDASGVHERTAADVPETLDRGDGGFWWIDVPEWDEDAEALLKRMGAHPLVIEACRRRNYVPIVHGYGDHVFLTTQSPYLGGAGHVHLLELDQIVGHDYLVTVHGPINPEVPLERALVETSGVLARVEGGRFAPGSPAELSYAITSAVARRQSAAVRDVATKLPGLERQVMGSQLRDPEALLEELFLIRHELITTRTMASQCHDILVRMSGISRLTLDRSKRDHVADERDEVWARDLADQFDRVRSLADGEAQFLFGVIELYQTKVHTKMTVAMERLAVIAAVTLPITAIASVVGMNVIVNAETHYTALIVLLAVMLAISLGLLRWARRQGWW
jgi:Mg2+ and Co2+ transporter CorA